MKKALMGERINGQTHLAILPEINAITPRRTASAYPTHRFIPPPNHPPLASLPPFPSIKLPSSSPELPSPSPSPTTIHPPKPLHHHLSTGTNTIKTLSECRIIKRYRRSYVCCCGESESVLRGGFQMMERRGSCFEETCELLTMRAFNTSPAMPCIKLRMQYAVMTTPTPPYQTPHILLGRPPPPLPPPPQPRLRGTNPLSRQSSPPRTHRTGPASGFG